MSLSASGAVLLVFLLTIPVCYIVNTVQFINGSQIGLLTCGVICFVIICTLIYSTLRKEDTDPFIYVLLFGTFSSVADIFIFLDNEGVTSGFMSAYLKDGEPYLATPFGSVICLWDAVGHYALYLYIMYCMKRKQSYRGPSLYWTGSIGQSMVVLLYGSISGPIGVRWSYALNIPYVIMPIWSAQYLIRQRPKSPSISKGTVWRRPLDCLLISGLIILLLVALVRGLAVLADPSHEYFLWYVHNVEPYLKDPVTFPKLQMLAYLFYYVPVYALCVYGLIVPVSPWLSDWTVVLAGASAQAQISHIGASLHPRTPELFRVTTGTPGVQIFWVINLFVLIFPHLLAFRCHNGTAVRPSSKETRNKLK